MLPVGCIEFKPNAINVIPSKAVFTVDLRNPDKEKLDNDEKILAAYLKDLAKRRMMLRSPPSI